MGTADSFGIGTGPTHAALGFHFYFEGNLSGQLLPLFEGMRSDPVHIPSGLEESGTSKGATDCTPICLERTGPDGPFELLIDGHSTFRTVDLGALVHQTVWEVTRRGIASRDGLLVLHSAALLIDNTTVLVSGPSGSGKSTLTAALVADGADYLTDEAVEIDRFGCAAAAIARPIHLSRDSLDTLGREIHAPDVPMPGGGAYLVTDSCFGTARPPTDTIIIFLDGLAGALHISRPLRSDAVARLARESFPSGAGDQARLEIVKKLVRQSEHLTLSGGSSARRASSIINLIRTRNPVA
jgi:hypothetical protein